MNIRILMTAVLAGTLMMLGCGDDENGAAGAGGTGGTAGAGGAAGAGGMGGAAGAGGMGGTAGAGGAAGNLIAPLDNDSLQTPAVTEFLSITGTRDFSYVDQISTPMGDTEDWVEFEFPNNANTAQQVRVTLDCVYSDAENGAQGSATVWEDDVEDTGLAAICNDGEQILTVDNTKVQSVRIHFTIDPTDDVQTLVDYTLTIVGFQ